MMYGVLHKICIVTQNISPVIETKGLSLCSQRLIVGTCQASLIQYVHCFSNILFNIILPFVPMTRTCLLPSDVPDQNVYILYICVVYAAVLCLPNAISLVILCKQFKLWIF